MADWSTRIPAAIEKGKKLFGDIHGTPVVSHEVNGVVVTAGEVALADALFKAHHEAVYKILRVGWDEHERFEAEDGGEPCTHCAPLRAFTEKIESR